MSTSIAPTIHQKIQIPYNYSAGPAMTKFLRGLKDKLIYASVCSKCGRRSVPPIGFCGRCWTSIEEFVAIEQRGTVETFVQSLRHSAQGPAEHTAYALIRLDGCTTSLVHMVRWNAANPLSAGSIVVPVWKEERSASILDIAYFQPS